MQQAASPLRLYFILHTSRGNPSKLSPFGLEGLGEDRGCMRM